ncbi:MAG: hypothetical protein ABSG88_25230, partial [Bradyrhizobium sp.]
MTKPPAGEGIRSIRLGRGNYEAYTMCTGALESAQSLMNGQDIRQGCIDAPMSVSVIKQRI